jgi:Domain of unknown function (DUF4861)
MARINLQVSVATALFVTGCGAACAQRNVPWELPNFSDRLEVRISNPHSDPVHTLALIDVAGARTMAPGFPGTLAIVADQSGRTRYVPSQVDTEEAGESPDAFVIPVNLTAHSQQTLEIYYSNTLKESLPWPKRVHATRSYGYNHSTAAIESELIGYRSYGGFYLDVQAHEKGQFGLFNSLIGFTSISSPAAEGEDVLHVGDTLGLGGIFLRSGGSVYRPPVNTPDYAHRPAKPDEPTYRVLAEGPLRALVEEDLPHWKIGDDEVALRAVYEMREDEEAVRCRVWVTPLHLSRAYEVGAGVRELPEMHVLQRPSVVALDGIQDASTGRIGLGLAFDLNSAHRADNLITPEGSNEIVLSGDSLRQGHGVSLTYWVAAAWQGSGWTSPVQHVADVLQRETEQPVVTLLQHESTPHPERLTSEPQ